LWGKLSDPLFSAPTTHHPASTAHHATHRQLLLSFLQPPLHYRRLRQPQRGGNAHRVYVLRRLKVECGGWEVVGEQLLVADLCNLLCV